MCVHMCACVHAMASVWSSENNLCKSALHVYHVGPRYWTQVVRFSCCKCLYLLSHAGSLSYNLDKFLELWMEVLFFPMGSLLYSQRTKRHWFTNKMYYDWNIPSYHACNGLSTPWEYERKWNEVFLCTSKDNGKTPMSRCVQCFFWFQNWLGSRLTLTARQRK